MRSYFKALLVLFMTTTLIFSKSESPREEFRGEWLSTVGNIDWPKSKYDSDAKKQNDLKNYMQKAKNNGLNAVLFQVRCACDAMYNSPYEPWSYWFSGTQGKAPSTNWDPLTLAVDEAHKLGMELHAWVNPYRAVKTPAYLNDSNYMTDGHISRTHPEWILKFSDIHILDPGLPEVREYITMILMDIVNRYDIDGLHMDDYFYPYSQIKNEDAQTFSAHSRGFTNIHDWRRDNINLLVEMVNDSINIVKPWVKWGISPFGVWKPGVPSGILAMDAYNTLYCDPIAWLEDQTVDYITPQLYWPFGGNQDYGKLIPWWASQVRKYNRHFYPGIGYHVGYLYSREEIPNQVQFNRDTKYCDGEVFFTAHDFDDNHKNTTDSLRLNYYYNTALWPLMNWKDSLPPSAPLNAELIINGDGSKFLSWDAPVFTSVMDSGYGYAVYRASHPLDELEMKDLIDLRIDQSRSFTDEKDGMFYYGITALNRLKQEGPIAEIEYPFVHPLYPEYANEWAPKEPTITWAAKSGATQYTLEISQNSDLSGATQYTLSDTSKELSFAYKTHCWWRVKADNISHWSPIWTFRTEEPPQVEIYEPVAYKEGTSISPEFYWEPFEDASSYDFQMATDPAMSNLIVNSTGLTDTSFQSNTLDHATYYYWRVRSNKYDRWTDIRSFKTREEFVSTLWENTQIADTYPVSFNDSLHNAALAVGEYFGNKIVLTVQSLNDLVEIKAFNATDGQELQFTLNLEGVSGGLHNLRDIEFSEDGVIYAANCAAIGESFKLYQWTDPLQAPVVVYQADNIAYRLGDHITISGRKDDGSVKCFVPGADSDKMLKLDWNSVSSSFEATQITLDRGNNPNPCMATVPGSDEYYVTSTEYYIRHFTSDGSNINWMKGNLTMPVNANAIASFAYADKKFIAGYVADTESAHIIDVSDGVRTALKAGATYRMGINENKKLLGDVEVVSNQDGSFDIFVLGNQNGIAAYRFDAASAVVSIDGGQVPEGFKLAQNYPNPFNPVTTIAYELKEHSDISISIYDISGKLVQHLYQGMQNAGKHEMIFDASTLASGQYIYRLTAGDASISRKMTLLK